MASGDCIPGRRRPDTPLGCLPDDLQLGDYWKCTRPSDGLPVIVKDCPSNLTNMQWFIYGPKAGLGCATIPHHTVREEDDGTASIRPGDGSSNSVVVTDGKELWHGYLDHGVWKEV